MTAEKPAAAEEAPPATSALPSTVTAWSVGSGWASSLVLVPLAAVRRPDRGRP